MMKILIAYDGSVDADGALHDLELAGLPTQAEARVVTFAIPMPLLGAEGWVPGGLTPQYALAVDGLLKNTRLVAERAAAYLGEQFPGWKVKAVAALGSAAEGILAQAEAWAPDLVVLGSHGHTALGRLLLGSVSLNVLHHAPATVRITRPRLRTKQGPPRIMVAVDGSDGSLAAVAEVAARAWPRKTEVRVVGIVDTRGEPSVYLDDKEKGNLGELLRHHRQWLEKRVDEAAQGLADAGIGATSVILSGDPRESLILEAKAFSADCIFLGSRGLGALDRFLLGSVSSAVASHAPCTVEILRPPRGVRGAGKAKAAVKPKARPRTVAKPAARPAAKTPAKSAKTKVKARSRS